MLLTKIENNETKFRQYYLSCFSKVAGFIKKQGGSLDEAKDVFQDALVALFIMKSKERSEEIADEESYLIGAARNIWYKKFNTARIKEVAMPDMGSDLLRTDDDEPKVSERLFAYLEKTGKKCLNLLKSFYFDKLSMQEIAEKFSFSGERSATVQKHKCIEKLRRAVSENSLRKEDFYE